MLPILLAEIGLPFLIKAVKTGLERLDHPVAKVASQALGGVESEVSHGTISTDDLQLAQKHIETMRDIESKEYQTIISEINQSIRAEVSSSDPYVRRMRPTFGYIMAMTWAAQMFSLAYVIIAVPESSGEIIASMASLSTIWTVGLSVLGIYVYKRSEEKKSVSSQSSLSSKIKELFQK